MKNQIRVYNKNQEHSRVLVGTISVQNEIYSFSYSEEYKMSGGKPLIPFFDLDKVYHCNRLFPVFSSRLPDRKRKDIDRILEKYGMQTYDEFTLLQRSKGRLPIDLLEFIEPLELEEIDQFVLEVAGISHYDACSPNCQQRLLNIGDWLDLRLDECNKYDKYAVKLFYQNKLVGFIPVYYSEVISKYIKEGNKLQARVVYLKKCEHGESDSAYCCDCVKVRLIAL